MAQVLGIGYQSFKEVRTENIFYIDKTGFIREWWENADKVTLITRPRRFGKTLNMSLLECFFSNRYADRGDLFEGLSIWDEKSPEGVYNYRKLPGDLSSDCVKLCVGQDWQNGVLKESSKADYYKFVRGVQGNDAVSSLCGCRQTVFCISQ